MNQEITTTEEPVIGVVSAEILETKSLSGSTPSLESRAIRGTIWTLAVYATGQSVRLLSNILLSRLLVPQYFGLMALLNTMLMGLSLFSDFGLAPSVIRSKNGDDSEFLDTVWSVQVLRGIGLWMVCLAISWPAAQFYGQPRLRSLIPAVAFSLLINGLSSTSYITLARHLAIGKLARVELSLQAIQVVTTLLLAWAYPSVWALVIGRLTYDVARLAVGVFLIPGYRNRFGWNPEIARELISFGKWVFASTAVTFLASQADRLVLGKLVSLATLGLYSVTFAVADMPRQVILAFSSKIAFPFVAKFSHLPRAEFRAMVLHYRRFVLLGGALILVLVVTLSDIFLRHIYDTRYRDAAWMAPVLALGLWHTILYSTTGPCLVTLGKLRYNVTGYVLTALVILLLVPVSFHRWGMQGAVWTIAFSDVWVYVTSLYGLTREKLSPLKQDFQMTILFVACLAGSYALRVALGFPWPSAISLH
jgi:O-antigen/teichoic acid export membrane protein